MSSTSEADDKVVTLNPKKCPMCGKSVVHRFLPFCSRRCANLDLGNWLDESYRVPADEPLDLEEAFPDED